MRFAAPGRLRTPWACPRNSFAHAPIAAYPTYLNAMFGRLARWLKKRIGGIVWHLDCELAEKGGIAYSFEDIEVTSWNDRGAPSSRPVAARPKRLHQSRCCNREVSQEPARYPLVDLMAAGSDGLPAVASQPAPWPAWLGRLFLYRGTSGSGSQLPLPSRISGFAPQRPSLRHGLRRHVGEVAKEYPLTVVSSSTYGCGAQLPPSDGGTG